MLMKQRQLIILLAAACISLLIPAAHAESGATLQEVVATLEQGYAQLADLQADFSQRTVIASMNREQRGAGELFIRRVPGAPAMFRFNYKKPQPQQIVSDGKSVWFYLPADRQVLVTDVAATFEGGSGLTLDYLTGLGHVSRDFTIAFAGDGRDKLGNYLLELVPKKRSQVIAKLQISVAAEAVSEFLRQGRAQLPFPIVASVVYDPLGNKTFLDFSKIRVNSGMDATQFNFKMPAGVTVVRSPAADRNR